MAYERKQTDADALDELAELIDHTANENELRDLVSLCLLGTGRNIKWATPDMRERLGRPYSRGQRLAYLSGPGARPVSL